MTDSHKHKWRVADDQANTGTRGVRLVCEGHENPYSKHYLTVLRDLLEEYV